jgi:ParB-like chromosome segregation protein Spo0J
MAPAEMERLKASIREFGFAEPVIARREDFLVVGGHQRIQALTEILTEDGAPDADAVTVPTILLTGVDDARAKALNLALNRISGEWDYEKLGVLLAEFEATDPSLIGLTGFTEAEAADILNVAGDDTFQPQPSSEPPPDVDDLLAQDRRRFRFFVETDEGAAAVREALATFDPTDASRSLVLMAQAILDSAKGPQ